MSKFNRLKSDKEKKFEKRNSHHSTDSEKAIALSYDGKSAPNISAKGEKEIANQILKIAKEHDVPIYHDPGLAVLLSNMEIGDEIPEFLYITIAEVIAFAYMLDGKTEPDGFANRT